MKINNNLFFIPSAIISMFGFYNIYKLYKKIKEIEQDTEIILKTHNRYMEVQENQHRAIMRQHEAIKDLYNSIEGIACTLPFTNKHEWQNKMIERKFQRELDRHIDEDEHEKYKEEQMIKKIQEDQKRERDELNRKRKVEVQLDRVLNGNLTPQTKFWDDIVEEDWSDNKMSDSCHETGV
jgi:hypothetical protein